MPIDQLTLVLYLLFLQHKAKAKASYEAYFEELIVRRELADNFCYYNQHYDQFEGFPEWARKSLEAHAEDKRYAHPSSSHALLPFINSVASFRSSLYTYEELERGKTHDELWNAAQMEVRNMYSCSLHPYACFVADR
jgi:deoxyribodipyrimidine photo-lyase